MSEAMKMIREPNPYLTEVLFPGQTKPRPAIVVPFSGAYIVEIVETDDGLATGREMIEEDGVPFVAQMPCEWRETEHLRRVRDGRVLDVAREKWRAKDDDGDAALDARRDREAT